MAAGAWVAFAGVLCVFASALFIGSPDGEGWRTSTLLAIAGWALGISGLAIVWGSTL